MVRGRLGMGERGAAGTSSWGHLRLLGAGTHTAQGSGTRGSATGSGCGRDPEDRESDRGTARSSNGGRGCRTSGISVCRNCHTPACRCFHGAAPPALPSPHLLACTQPCRASPRKEPRFSVERQDLCGSRRGLDQHEAPLFSRGACPPHSPPPLCTDADGGRGWRASGRSACRGRSRAGRGQAPRGPVTQGEVRERRPDPGWPLLWVCRPQLGLSRKPGSRR